MLGQSKETNLTYIISDIDKALSFEWIATAFAQESNYNLRFILLNPGPTHLEEWLKKEGFTAERVRYRGKKDLLSALIRVRSLLKQFGTKVVHCHLFGANVVGLLAAKSLGIRQRIYTRHHSSFHHVYFPRAVYYDRLINYLATDIVAISGNVKEVLIEREKVKAKKIHLIPHGFELGLFQEVGHERVQAIRTKYHLSPEASPVIGVIARHTHWKGIQYIIPAFAKLLEDYPKAHLILANAQGDYKAEINTLLQQLPRGSFTEITFEHDLPALYQLFEVYVHTPIDHHSEAFGQTYIEALAAQTPSVFTLSGIASEFIKHQQNAWVVPYQDEKAIYQGIKTLLEDYSLCEQLKKQGLEDVNKLFKFQTFFENTKALYKI